jgi:transcriptional regulator with XRE-family HTH domain
MFRTYEIRKRGSQMQDGTRFEALQGVGPADAGRRRARTPAVKAVTAVDTHIGQRLRMQRKLAGLSQEQLAERLGVTFQQVQKYEKGTNRISASRLFGAARLLSVPVSFFFEGLATSDTQSENVIPMTRDEHDLLLAFRSAREDVRRPLVALVQASHGQRERASPSPQRKRKFVGRREARRGA